MSQIAPHSISKDLNKGTSRWMVVIYDNDYNSVDEVVQILMTATLCTIEEAEIEIWEAQEFGSTSVHFGPRDVCDDVSSIIAQIGVRTEVVQEWSD